ncbi:hypothetical protein [Williamsia sterculiae]|nr:hypothetical protein [Williamsia sterculiae]
MARLERRLHVGIHEDIDQVDETLLRLGVDVTQQGHGDHCPAAERP